MYKKKSIHPHLHSHQQWIKQSTLLVVGVDLNACLLPTDSTRASPATAVHIVEMCAAPSCEMICWFSSTPPCRTPRTCRSTWFRAGGRSWRDSVCCAAPLCARCSVTRPSLTATHQGWDRHPNLSAGISDYVYMGCNNQTIDLILNLTVFQLMCLLELPIEYCFHIPIYMLQSIAWLMTHETHAHPTSYI